MTPYEAQITYYFNYILIMIYFQIVCGSDHVTYESLCDLKEAACVRKLDNVTVLRTGTSCGKRMNENNWGTLS